MHSLHSGKNAFRMHSLLKPRTKICPGLLNKSLNFRTRTKNQDSPKTPEQILEFPNQNQEPRTKIPQRLLSKSWFLVLKSKIPQNQEPRTKIPQRLLSKSWFLVLVFKSKIPQNQEPRFPKDSWANLGSWFLVLNLRFPKDCWSNLIS